MSWTQADAERAQKRTAAASAGTNGRPATTVSAGPKEGPTDAQIAKRKDAQQRREEAALSQLNEQAVVHYLVGTGESTLGTTKVIHLQPDQAERLHQFLEEELGAQRY